MYRILASFFILFTCLYANADKVSSALKRDYYDKNFLDQSLPINTRIEYGDSLRNVTPGMPFKKYVTLGDMLYDAGRYGEMAEMFSQLLNSLPKDSLRQRLHSQWEIGISKFTARDYAGSLEAAYGILHTDKPDSLIHYNLYAYLILCDYYKSVRKWSLAWKYQNQGVELLSSIKPSHLFDTSAINKFDITFTHTSASLYMEQGDYDKAYEALKNIKAPINTVEGELTQLITYAGIAYKKGDYRLASHYYQAALKINSHNFNKCCAVVGYMQLLIEQGDTAAFRHQLDSLRNDILKIRHSPLEREHLENLAEYMHLTGRYKEEADYRRKIMLITDSLYDNSLEMSANTIADRFEYSEIEEKYNKSERINRFDLWIIISLGVMVLVIGGICWWQRNKINRLTHRITGLSHEKEEADLLHEKNVEQTQKSLELQSQELSSMTMYMARLNEALDSIQKNVEESSIPEQKRLTNISKLLKELERQDNVWEMFRTYFDSVNHSFSQKLYKLHPQLTNAELRMCAFILMGLTTKEIAILTNRSVRTIEVIKYNLRKKLGIEESTSDYLKNLALK